MKIHRIKCDRCGCEVTYNKSRQMVIAPQQQANTVSCAPDHMMNSVNTAAYAPITYDLCHECVKEVLRMIPGTEEIVRKF